MQDKADRARQFTPAPAEGSKRYEPPAYVREMVRKIAPGWDVDTLISRHNEWKRCKGSARNPDGAFISWVKKFTKGKSPD